MEQNKRDNQATLKKFFQFCSRNWALKLLSFALAILLWGGLITQDGSLTREKVFSNVSINIMNADTLQRNGFIIVSGLDDLPTVRIRADVPQRVYSTVTATNYNVRIDLSRIKDTGVQTLPVIATSSSAYGTVTDISVGSVTVQVEKYETRSRIPVRLNTTGTAPEGYYAGDATVNPIYVSVAGPATLVNSIVRCVVDYDMSILTPHSGIERSAVPMHLIDINGNEVNSSLITVMSDSTLLDSLVVEQPLYATKQLKIDATSFILGEPQKGYYIKSITTQPEVVTVAASEAILDSLTSFQLADYVTTKMGIEGATSSSISQRVRVTRPDDIAYLSTSIITVVVEIAPEQ